MSRYIKGQHNVISDDSGQKFKSDEMRMTWDNKLVHYTEWQEKHPQITVRGRKDQQAVKDARPRQTTNYVSSIDKTVTYGLDNV